MGLLSSVKKDNMKDIVNKTLFSDGLKKQFIKEFTDAGIINIEQVQGSTVGETEHNIRTNTVVGFLTGKHTYLQANILATIIHGGEQRRFRM